ncbi:MAG TPA: hemerythrin family protein [Noviherbaspirillum sp.]
MTPHAASLTTTFPGLPIMDRLHRDLFAALDELSHVSDHEFLEGYRMLVRNVERAFRQEEEWMEKANFPAMHMHQEQHARVLGGLHNVHMRIMGGDLQVGRKVVDDLLPQWLAFHVSTMDTALAVAMQMSSALTGEPASALS